MLTFVTLSRWSQEAPLASGSNFELETSTMQEIRKRYPDVECLHNGASQEVGSYTHIFITPDIETAEEVAEIVGTFGYATPEIWTATDWTHYKRMLRKMPKVN